MNQERSGASPPAKVWLNPKEWLSRGRWLRREIDTLREAKRAAEDRAAGLSSGASAGRRGPKGRRDAAMVQAAQYGMELDERIAELEMVLSEITRAIAAVDEGSLRLLLLSRYVLFKKWEQIALDMGYSYTNVTYRLHPKALEAVGAYIANDTKGEK